MAVSDHPAGPFEFYGYVHDESGGLLGEREGDEPRFDPGVIVCNNDWGIDTYKPTSRPMAYGGNNHGSIVEIAGLWYIFYHRQTNGHHFSRQGCMEKIRFLPDGVHALCFTFEGEGALSLGSFTLHT